MVLDSSGSCDTGWLRQKRSADCWQDCSDNRRNLRPAQVQDVCQSGTAMHNSLAVPDVQGTLSA
jgi:hypothetical protein